jgi:hypothetical protein
MGWEVQLNAIAPDCELLRRINDNELDAELLTFVRIYFRQRREQGRRDETFAYGDKNYEIFVNDLEQLMRDKPGIENRYCDLDRRFDWLKWLLTECSFPQDAQLAEIAIRGESHVTPTARSVQGFPICWTSPSTCELIDLWLSELNRPLLESKFDPIRMNCANLYKWQQSGDREDVFESIIEDFNSLQRLYRNVVKNSEAVLVVTD